MMKRSVHHIRSAVSAAGRILTAGLYGILLLSQSGCIMDDNDGCAYDSNLYIEVDSRDSGYDETLDAISLILFGSDRTFINSPEVTPDEVTGHLPIPISYGPNDFPWAVSWGNLGDYERIIPPTSGETMDQAFVVMQRGDDGYALTPDNLYFGTLRLSGKREEYLVITPKTGRITITARGVWRLDDSDEYYFTVETPYDRYDYQGNASAGSAVLKLSGVYTEGSFATAEACPMFHFPSPDPEGRSLRVKLYKVPGGSGEPQTLADVQYDANGMPIAIQREMTTHILIALPETGGIEVGVTMTGWDEFFQWGDW